MVQLIQPLNEFRCLKWISSYADLCNPISAAAYSAGQPCYGPLRTSSGVFLIAAPSLGGGVLSAARVVDGSCWLLDLTAVCVTST